MEIEKSFVGEGQDKAKAFENIPGEIFCVFKTNLDPEYQLDEMKLNIKSSLTEKELSELVTNLLRSTQPDNEYHEGLQFEFLLNDHFIRGNLKSHILRYNIDTEATLTIYYTFALNKPKTIKQNKEEDWVKDIAIFAGKPTDFQPYVVGFFNGTLSLYDQKNSKVKSFELCDSIIKSMGICENPILKSENQQMLITGSGDEMVRVSTISWSQKAKDTTSIETVAVGEGHKSSVETVAINPVNPMVFCSGSFDGEILMWKLNESSLTIGSQGSGKRNGRKKFKSNENELKSQYELKIHKEAISNLLWKSKNEIISGSHDHWIKYYDTEKFIETNSIRCGDNIVSSLAHYNNFLLTGHEDAYIRLWDERQNLRNVAKLFKSHSLWVSSLAFHPLNEYIFISSSFDRQVKVWDLRSDFPLSTIKTHINKVFSSAWNGPDHIITGGSDSMVGIHSLQTKK